MRQTITTLSLSSLGRNPVTHIRYATLIRLVNTNHYSNHSMIYSRRTIATYSVGLMSIGTSRAYARTTIVAIYPFPFRPPSIEKIDGIKLRTVLYQSMLRMSPPFPC
jgi:hypothetical protein